MVYWHRWSDHLSSRRRRRPRHRRRRHDLGCSPSQPPRRSPLLSALRSPHESHSTDLLRRGKKCVHTAATFLRLILYSAPVWVLLIPQGETYICERREKGRFVRRRKNKKSTYKVGRLPSRVHSAQAATPKNSRSACLHYTWLGQWFPNCQQIRDPSVNVLHKEMDWLASNLSCNRKIYR